MRVREHELVSVHVRACVFVRAVGQGGGESEMREGNGVGDMIPMRYVTGKNLSEIEEKKMRNNHVSGGGDPKQQALFSTVPGRPEAGVLDTTGALSFTVL